jgi:N-acetyl-alpha-D-glucosaminyl L-malate synthase BshA
MRIGITCYPSYGGSGVVATELGLDLARRGHRIHFITYRWPFRLAGYHRNVSYHQVDTPEYPLFKYPPYCLALSAKMAQVVREERLELLHVHYAIPHATAAFMARQMVSHPLRVITTLHGTDITLVGNDPSFHDIVRFSTQSSDGITAVSRYLRDETAHRFRIEQPIEVIYNFVDPDRFRPRSGPRKEFHGDRKILMHVSNFRPVKRIGDVIEIFRGIRRTVPSSLVMVGDGPDRPAAEAKVEELGLKGEVHFLGNQLEVESLLPQADLFLLPSDRESFGLVALEAMSCGVPVIGYRAGGLPEVVSDAQTGYLAEVGEVDRLTELARKILEDDDLRAEMGAQARRRAQECFRSDLIIPQYEIFYQRVLSGSGGAGDGLPGRETAGPMEEADGHRARER